MMAGVGYDEAVQVAAGDAADAGKDA
jgi:hypothetical protein